MLKEELDRFKQTIIRLEADIAANKFEFNQYESEIKRLNGELNENAKLRSESEARLSEIMTN